MPKPEIFLIGGFLGAGKTTFLQNILSSKIHLPSTAILVNEFGKISVDGLLLKSRGTQLIELQSGCICCSMKGEFIQSLREVLHNFNVTQCFVETTGIADTTEIVDLLRQSTVLEKAVLKRVICVLDADLWQEREIFGTTFFNQIKAADLILLNKIDLVEKEQIGLFMEDLREINAEAMIVPTHLCAIDHGILSDDKYLDLEEFQSLKVTVPQGEKKTELNFSTFLFEESDPLSETCFKTFLDRIPRNLFRIKGVVKFEDKILMLNHVGGKSYWSTIQNQTKTKLVFIGWDVQPTNILEDVKKCVSEDQ